MIRLRPRHVVVAVLAVLSLTALTTLTGVAMATTTSVRAKTATSYWHPVTWTNTAPPITIGAPQCSAAGVCLYPWTEAGESHGDLEGTYVASGVATANATGELSIVRMDTFTGTIKGCGTGTITARAVEAVNTPTPEPGRWMILDGFGTGDLAGVHGFGEATGGTTPTGLSTTLTGSLRCAAVH
jgi:hypothetical protein